MPPLPEGGAAELASMFLDQLRAGTLGEDNAVGRSPHREMDLRVLKDPDPLPIIDALLALSEGDEEVLAYIGASPLEDLIVNRRDLWGKIDQRCLDSPLWAKAARNTWIHKKLARRLPYGLAALVIRL